MRLIKNINNEPRYWCRRLAKKHYQNVKYPHLPKELEKLSYWVRSLGYVIFVIPRELFEERGEVSELDEIPVPATFVRVVGYTMIDGFAVADIPPSIIGELPDFKDDLIITDPKEVARLWSIDELFRCIEDSWEYEFPGCYDALNNMKKKKADGEMYWPDCCELPENIVRSYLRDNLCYDEESGLMAMFQWRQHRTIFKFDPDLVEILAKQAEDIMSGSIPKDIILTPPYQGTYIRCPNLREGSDGFFYWIGYDTDTEKKEVCVLWINENRMTYIYSSKDYDTIFDECNENCEDDFNIKKMREAIQLIMYITSEKADVEMASGHVNDKIKKSKKANAKAAPISPKKVDIYEVGFRIGATLRNKKKGSCAKTESSGSANGSTKCPHARRGHYHHYWTGKRDGERKLVRKWVFPTFIHAESAENELVTIRPVKQ